jgi:WXG100 family type VII secretion target
MADIVVNHGVLNSGSADLGSDANYIQQVLDDFDAQVRTLVANWDGDAQQAYQVAKAEWSQAMTSMRNTLNTISQMLAATSEEFQNIDRRGAQMWG